MGRYKVRCNAILPGFIDTPMTQNAKVKAKVVNQLLGLISLGRIGVPEGMFEKIRLIFKYFYIRVILLIKISLSWLYF